MLIIQRPTVEAIGEEEGNRQRFAVSPLEPGFGHTLGNSIRRTLLSSIPGAAVTQVRFDDALHEFTTLPGVKEDVTDIILNLKDVVLRVHADDGAHAALRQAGARGRLRRRPAAHRGRGGPQPGSPHRHPQRQGPPGHRRHRGAGPGLRLGGAQQALHHHRRHPRRLDLLPGATGGLLGGAGAGRAVDRLRPPRPRHRDRRVAHAPRGAGLGRRHPALAGGAGGRPRGRAPGPRAGRGGDLDAAAHPTSTSPSRTSTCPSGPATASSAPRSTPSASSWSGPPRTSWPSRTSVRSPSTR